MDELTDKAVIGRRYRGVSNAARKAERHQKLVDAGLLCFARDGFHQATVRGVCAEAGLTERYFYESFARMEDLFRTVYLAVSEQIRGRILSVVAELSEADLATFSRAAMRTFFESIQHKPAFVPVLFQEALSVSRDMTRLALSTLNEFVELLVTLGQATFAQRADVRLDAGLVSAGLVGGIMHMAVRWADSGFQMPLDQVVDNAMLIFAGVASVAVAS